MLSEDLEKIAKKIKSKDFIFNPTVKEDIKSAIKHLMNAEGSLYHASDNLKGHDLYKELNKIYKSVRLSYDSLLSFEKKLKKIK